MAGKASPQLQTRINTVAKELASGKDRGYILGKYGKKWEISRTSIDRIIEKAKPLASTLSDKADQAAEATLISETVEAVKNGLKTKSDRLLILQNEIDQCLLELNPVAQPGKRKARAPRLFEKIALRKVIRELQSEISKIEGDYAETSIKLKGDKENPLYDLSTLPVTFR